MVQKSQKISLRNIKMVPKGKNIQKLWEKGKKIPTLVFVDGKLYVMAPKLHELSRTGSFISFSFCFTRMPYLYGKVVGSRCTRTGV